MHSFRDEQRNFELRKMLDGISEPTESEFTDQTRNSTHGQRVSFPSSKRSEPEKKQENNFESTCMSINPQLFAFLEEADNEIRKIELCVDELNSLHLKNPTERQPPVMKLPEKGALKKKMLTTGLEDRYVELMNNRLQALHEKKDMGKDLTLLEQSLLKGEMIPSHNSGGGGMNLNARGGILEYSEDSFPAEPSFVNLIGKQEGPAAATDAPDEVALLRAQFEREIGKERVEKESVKAELERARCRASEMEGKVESLQRRVAEKERRVSELEQELEKRAGKGPGGKGVEFLAKNGQRMLKSLVLLKDNYCRLKKEFRARVLDDQKKSHKVKEYVQRVRKRDKEKTTRLKLANIELMRLKKTVAEKEKQIRSLQKQISLISSLQVKQTAKKMNR